MAKTIKGKQASMQDAMQSEIDITLNCSNVVSYFHLQNGISPIKRLYVKNTAQIDKENIRLKVYSEPAFLMPLELEQAVLPRRATTKFETGARISPLFMVALDKHLDAKIIVEVYEENTLISQATCPVQLLAFNECDFEENPAGIATFVKRTAEINKLLSLVNRKLDSWNVSAKSTGYAGSKNSVRNFFAATFSVLAEQNFIKGDTGKDREMVNSHAEILISKIASPLELALLYASIVEGNGQNPLIGRVAGKWCVGCFLNNDCFANIVNDDASVVIKKLERGVNELSLIFVDDIYGATAFERAEKSAIAFLKKADTADFFIDIKRARIMHVYPLPERVMREGGYDVVGSKDFITGAAPSQIKEYNGEIGGEKEISRVTQWERKLLDMDMRNALLNFKVTQAVAKLLVPNIEDFIENIGENKTYTLGSKPKENTYNLDKISTGFERNSYLKPFVDYTLYEYKNKRLRTVYDTKEHDSTLLRLFRKEKSIQEETGTVTLYLAAGFLKWCEKEDGEERYAPIFLYPVSITKKGIAQAVYNLEVNSEDAQINTTLLEFLYQEFNLDMRGLAQVELNDAKDMLSVLARVKRETVDFKGWEVMDNVFLASLSFANYLLWYDVKYKTEKFREHPIINSLINNRLELDTSKYEMSDRSSDEAYIGKEKMYLPISADSSQYSAIYDSLTKSFVLHGPPGTGKSQTITNIIANNIVRGRRVLFVAEKMAALSVVHRRLQNIGLGDFCLELHSDKTNKNAVLSHIINTLSLAETKSEEEATAKADEIGACVEKLQGELDSMHRKRALGFSLYEAILNYFENQDAPDCLRIDSLFYEKLTEKSFNNYLEVLTELALRAKECGDIDKSPFKHIGLFSYSETWRSRADTILEIYLLELKHLRHYTKNLLPIFNIRTVSMTRAKIEALYNICKLLRSNNVAEYFKNSPTAINAKGTLDSFNEAYKKDSLLMHDYNARYGIYPSDIDIEALRQSIKSGDYPRAVKRLFPSNLDKKERASFVEHLEHCESNRLILMRRTAELAAIFELSVPSVPAVYECVKKMNALFDNARRLYADLDISIFNECCSHLTSGGYNEYLEYYTTSYDVCQRAKTRFHEVFHTDGYHGGDEINAIVEYISNIQRNLNYIPSWCRYQEIVDKCRANGFEFVLEPLGAGEITANDILRCFKKCVYFNFIRSELFLDDVLCQFSGLTLEETANKFKQLTEEYERLTRDELYERLVASLPRTDTAGEHNLERVILMRAEKSNMKGTTLRNLFAQIPNVLKSTCPCMLMSPTSVSQFLDLDMDKFDLVVFDEASQVPTCKAVGAIARGKEVIIVGDPKQLPPTTFFSSDFKDDEHYDSEDLESILDDCLALGMPENHLLWHYRSCHESLIAFSNAMYYDNTLLTFPSPNELNSKVSFKYVDGIYERGGSKCNKKEGDELVAEVIARLKNPALRTQSIGIVTFNTAQQNYIENQLSKQVHANNLEAVAYDGEEPVFVKNLENVQGDERDVILFSVGYGPDDRGRLSLNFGPINQAGGYKRLNVAVTRARMEMRVFSAITGNMIDLSRTDSKGVAGLRAFLEYAERGRDMLAIDSGDIANRPDGIGALIAHDLKDKGVLCEYNVGVSNFKIDVAVVDPRNKDKYILAIICDSENACKLNGVKDRVAMQTRVLKKLGWNTYQMWTINYFNNPRREITKIKDYITTLTEKKVMNKKTVRDITNRYKCAYKSCYTKPMAKGGAEYVLNFVNEEKIMAKIRDIIEIESPIEETMLMGKLLAAYNIPKTSKRAVAVLNGYVKEYASFEKEWNGKTFYVDKSVETFRPNDARVTRAITDIYPQEIIAAARCCIDTRLNLTRGDIVKEVLTAFGIPKKTKQGVEWVEKAIELGVAQNQIIVTVDEVLTT